MNTDGSEGNHHGEYSLKQCIERIKALEEENKKLKAESAELKKERNRLLEKVITLKKVIEKGGIIGALQAILRIASEK